MSQVSYYELNQLKAQEAKNITHEKVKTIFLFIFYVCIIGSIVFLYLENKAIKEVMRNAENTITDKISEIEDKYDDKIIEIEKKYDDKINYNLGIINDALTNISKTQSNFINNVYNPFVNATITQGNKITDDLRKANITVQDFITMMVPLIISLGNAQNSTAMNITLWTINFSAQFSSLSAVVYQDQARINTTSLGLSTLNTTTIGLLSSVGNLTTTLNLLSNSSSVLSLTVSSLSNTTSSLSLTVSILSNTTSGLSSTVSSLSNSITGLSSTVSNLTTLTPRISSLETSNIYTTGNVSNLIYNLYPTYYVSNTFSWTYYSNGVFSKTTATLYNQTHLIYYLPNFSLYVVTSTTTSINSLGALTYKPTFECNNYNLTIYEDATPVLARVIVSTSGIINIYKVNSSGVIIPWTLNTGITTPNLVVICSARFTPQNLDMLSLQSQVFNQNPNNTILNSFSSSLTCGTTTSSSFNIYYSKIVNSVYLTIPSANVVCPSSQSFISLNNFPTSLIPLGLINGMTITSSVYISCMSNITTLPLLISSNSGSNSIGFTTNIPFSLGCVFYIGGNTGVYGPSIVYQVNN